MITTVMRIIRPLETALVVYARLSAPVCLPAERVGARRGTPIAAEKYVRAGAQISRRMSVVNGLSMLLHVYIYIYIYIYILCYILLSYAV